MIATKSNGKATDILGHFAKVMATNSNIYNLTNALEYHIQMVSKHTSKLLHNILRTKKWSLKLVRG